MDEQKINNIVLIAPLDWGLGHATRCIPIIKLLQKKGCRIIIAADGAHHILLRQAFPELEFLHLKGYGIKYAKKNMLFNLAKQLPSFLKTIKAEKVWLDKTIEDYKISLVISDNRYGLWSKKIPCIFITHQLQLQVPFLMKWADKTIQKRLYSLIENFSFCWVPDIADTKDNLSGKLGHPVKMPKIPVSYIGPLSRFVKNGNQEKKYELMVCLSGPEPQRSFFESIILPQLKSINGKVLLVRGKPDSKAIIPQENNVTIFNHLATMQMQQAFEQSNFVLSRCGYSTLMDMQALGCKCIYVPTPGQTEQEYLGQRLFKFDKAVVLKQDKFDVKNALTKAEAFNYKITFSTLNNMLEEELEKLLKMP